MKDAINKKMYFFVDESGDTIFFNKKGNDLIKAGTVSSIFIVGYLETENMNEISKNLNDIKEEIKSDLYLKDIPSVKKSIIHFHAKDDCPEVREKVFKSIAKMNIKAFIIVGRKNCNYFKIKFNANVSKFYEYFVEKLFENRLHLYSDIDIYFSKMGSVIREQNMKLALEKAKGIFKHKWDFQNNNQIRIFIQEPSQISALQVIDYILWSVNRVFEKADARYYNFIKDKIGLIHDIFDVHNYPNNYYTVRNPLDIKKISPLKAR